MKEIERDLVIARIKSMPKNGRILVDNEGTLTKADMIKHVEDGSDLGEFIVNAFMRAIRILKEA